MTTTTLRKRLTDYLQIADDKKVKAMYMLLENDIEQERFTEYSDVFKKELDTRYAYYKNGGKMISAKEADKKIFLK